MHINTSGSCLERAMRSLKWHQVYPVHKAGCQGSLGSGDSRSRVHETSWHENSLPLQAWACSAKAEQKEMEAQQKASNNKSTGCLQKGKKLASEAIAGA